MWPRLKSTLGTLPVWQIAMLVIFVAIVFLTIFGPYLAPYSTTAASPVDRLLPPGAAHWFGTDDNGIDILSRLLAAPRTDVVIAVVATAISVLLGSPIGVVVALFESRRGARAAVVAETTMRLLEVVQAFPVFVFAMVLVAVFGGSEVNIIIAIAFVNTPVFVRLVRAEVLSLVQRPFAEAARAVGNSEARVGFRHILPNAIPTMMVQVSVTVGFAILLTAGLSFVGGGVKPPTPELGSMIASGAKFLIINQWWPALFPGLALGIVVFAFAVFGEILNKLMEPRAVRGVDRRRSAALDAGRVTGAPEPVALTMTPVAPAVAAVVTDSAAAAPPPLPELPPVFPTAAVTDTRAQGAAVLTVQDLVVRADRRDAAPLLRDITFSLRPGERLGIVGESGAGKSVLVRAVLRLLPPQLVVSGGHVRYDGTDLLAIDREAMRGLRSRHIAAILPNAKSQLHPLTTVGAMLASALRAHERVSAAEVRGRSIELLRMVGMNDPEQRLGAYPHELSGGMAQRVCLALALMYHPKLLVADEPTAGLDVTIQRQVLDLIQKLARDRGTAQLIITGDLGIAAQYCDKVAVMQAGRIVEVEETRAFFAAPRHPYSRHLLASVRG